MLAFIPEQPSQRKDDDVELARAAGQGDDQARRTLADRLLDRVRATVYYLAPQDPDVDDLVQLALVEILRSAHGFRGESRLETWADRIAVRSTMRLIKQKRRREAVVGLEREPLEGRSLEQALSAGEAVQTEQPQEQELTRRQVRQRLALLLDRISPERRQALVLRWVHGESLPEIAALTGAPLNTVRDRIQVGRKQLRKLILNDPVLRDWAEVLS